MAQCAERTVKVDLAFTLGTMTVSERVACVPVLKVLLLAGVGVGRLAGVDGRMLQEAGASL